MNEFSIATTGCTLLQVGNINPEGSEGFSAAETELEMRVGVGRHDSSLTHLIYDQVSIYTIHCHNIVSSRQLGTMERRYSILGFPGVSQL